MQIHHDIDKLPSFRNGVITFGSFDGVHLGHVELINRMNRLARQHDGETVLVTFHPHPRQVIYPNDKSLQLLSSEAEKIKLIEKHPVDHLVICPFTVEFSQMLADEYISNFIVRKFQPRYIVIGYDHRFGLNRAGSIDHLKAYEEKGGFKVYEIEQQITERIQISSTRIRNFLNEGSIETANKLLGHPYLISGKVVRGHQLGEKLGYPTANIEIQNSLKLIPPEGIYAARILYNEQILEGMLYIGSRPTVTQSGKISIEVNIFNFTEDIYGEELFVEVLKYIRTDQKFDNLEALREQLDTDKVQVEAYFDKYHHGMDSTSVVILNYNGQDHLRRFLPGLVRFTDDKIIVADNGSTDNSQEILRSEFPYVDLISLDKNYGFAGGYNMALRQVDDKYLVLLNSDVEVTNGWLPPLIQFMEEHPEVGACQPKVKSYTNKSTFEYAGAAGGLMDWLGYPFCQGRILNEVEDDLGQYDISREVFWATGAAMVIRKKVFEEFGGFDADFFAHMEEIDLCWRLKKAGYQIYVVPDSVVYHLGGGTLSYLSPKKTYLNFRNGLTLLLKNEKTLKLLWLLPMRAILDVVAALRFLLVGESGNARAVFKAMLYNVTHLGNALRKRKAFRKKLPELSIGSDNTMTGRYKGSIIWEYFALGKRKYSELKHFSSNII